MSRTNHTLEYNRYRRHKTDIAKLGNVGITIFRQADTHQFDQTFRFMAEEYTGRVVRPRTGNEEAPPAVILVDRIEVKRQRALGSVSVHHALDKIYDELPSLRRSIKVKPAGVQLLGRGRGENRSIAVLFDEDSKQELIEERDEILSSLEEFANLSYDYSWSQRLKPHVSLARAVTSRKHEMRGQEMSRLALSLPEEIVLNRATFLGTAHPNSTLSSRIAV